MNKFWTGIAVHAAKGGIVGLFIAMLQLNLLHGQPFETQLKVMAVGIAWLAYGIYSGYRIGKGNTQ